MPLMVIGVQCLPSGFPSPFREGVEFLSRTFLVPRLSTDSQVFYEVGQEGRYNRLRTFLVKVRHGNFRVWPPTTGHYGATGPGYPSQSLLKIRFRYKTQRKKKEDPQIFETEKV